MLQLIALVVVACLSLLYLCRSSSSRRVRSVKFSWTRPAAFEVPAEADLAQGSILCEEPAVRFLEKSFTRALL